MDPNFNPLALMPQAMNQGLDARAMANPYPNPQLAPPVGRYREMTIDEAGDELIDMIRRTANGRNTAAEALGHREFSMTKLYRSA